MKYKYCLLLILFFVSITSCEKILDKEPLDFLTPADYYNTEEKLEANLVGVYDALGLSGVYGNRMLYRLGLEADEGYYARSSPEDGPQVYDFTAGHSDINSYWTGLYTGIGRANALLANIDHNSNINSNVRSRIRGETLFLRGYFYFMLVHTYGGVPLVLEPVLDVEKVDIPRSTAKDVYEQILADMKQAEGLVKGIRALGFGGRVSKSAVRGILARVCLHMAGEPVKDVSKYEEARMWAKKVIDDTDASHSLIPDYSQIFINYAQDLYDINESIWEVEFRGNDTDAYTETGGVGYLNGPNSRNIEVGEGFGGIRVTEKLYKSYSDGDLRRDWTIANFTYNTNGTKRFSTSLTPTGLYARTSGKYRREFETLTPKARTRTPQNFPLLRFSDVLLMFAEADFEINGNASPEAIEAVNKVRRRAWSTGIKSVTITNGGSGYTSAPQVIFTNGGGSDVVATATVSGGKVTAVRFAMDPIKSFTNGAGYMSEPNVSFVGGGGSGATATATIYKKEEADLTIQDLDDFRQTIQNERLRELAFETLRKADLIRWGVFIYEMNKIGQELTTKVPTAYWGQRYRNVWERHLLWPIPTREMGLNNALVQNPNW